MFVVMARLPSSLDRAMGPRLVGVGGQGLRCREIQVALDPDDPDIAFGLCDSAWAIRNSAPSASRNLRPYAAQAAEDEGRTEAAGARRRHIERHLRNRQRLQAAP